LYALFTETSQITANKINISCDGLIKIPPIKTLINWHFYCYCFRKAAFKETGGKKNGRRRKLYRKQFNLGDHHVDRRCDHRGNDVYDLYQTKSDKEN
jgi:hypothetical protein